jgi:hypothetical protein
MTLADKPRTQADPTEALTKFRWEPQPAASRFLAELMKDALERNAWLRGFADRLYSQSGNRIGDLVRLWIISDTPENRSRLAEAGYAESDVPGDGPVFVNRSGMFPDVMLADHPEMDLGLKVESVADFAAVHGIDAEPWGQPGSPGRLVFIAKENGLNVYAIEKRGHHGWTIPKQYPSLEQQQQVLERFRTRRRRFASDEEGYDHTEKLIDAAIAGVGRDLACELFFAAEREYWQRRNRAAQYQKARQDALGIGWANHDHHTYRNSRTTFHRLVRLWEKLGFECRERFYPGVEAGWGAQVMEQPVCGIVTFNDVDISPDELMTDFAHEPMTERNKLGTVGLWCALHGESVLAAGMHHLECTFDFDALGEQMQREAGIGVMKPFSDFPYLKQQFTQGERWEVEGARIDKLLSQGLIGREQAEEFRKNGAIGSHLENLERNDGFKGFNQTGVTEIIHATDPRRQ